MSVTYDAGALVAADRSNRAVWADHKVRLQMGLLPRTTAPVVAQVSRTPRQVQLRRFLRGCELDPFLVTDAHAVGELLAKAGISDVIDAHLVLVSSQSTHVVITSDVEDIKLLSSYVSGPIDIRPV